MTIPEILENPWFREDYKPAHFEHEEDVNLDDVDAVFSDSEVKLPKYRVFFTINCTHITRYELVAYIVPGTSCHGKGRETCIHECLSAYF